MSVQCGKPTPGGVACRRLVKTPGGPCGAAHLDLLSPTGASPTGTAAAAVAVGAGDDPFGPGSPFDNGYRAGWDRFQAGEPRGAEPADQDTPSAELGSWEGWGDAEAEHRAARSGW